MNQYASFSIATLHCQSSLVSGNPHWWDRLMPSLASASWWIKGPLAARNLGSWRTWKTKNTLFSMVRLRQNWWYGGIGGIGHIQWCINHITEKFGWNGDVFGSNSGGGAPLKKQRLILAALAGDQLIGHGTSGWSHVSTPATRGRFHHVDHLSGMIDTPFIEMENDHSQ